MEGGSFIVEVHIVQKGDTLWKISRLHGVSFEELKRVNAHLANPDYIVPGMKIFLPKKAQGKKETPPVKKGGQGGGLPTPEKKQEKKPAIPKEKTEKPKAPEQPKAPVPLPKPPVITTKPVEEGKVERPKAPTPLPKPPPPQAEKPKVEKPKVEKPKVEKPKVEKPKVPEQTVPGQMHPMLPIHPFPIYGVPCGWMPIYDADCYGYHHHGHMHHAPQHPKPTRPMTQLPVPESSHHKPLPPHIHQKEKHIEKQHHPSHELQLNSKLLSPQLNEQPFSIPNIESPSVRLPVPKIEEKKEFTSPTHERQVPPPTAQPMPYQNWSYPQPSMHPAQLPCGCQQFVPMPPVMPMQPHPFCHQCHQQIGQHAQPPMYHPAPYHWQGPRS